MKINYKTRLELQHQILLGALDLITIKEIVPFRSRWMELSENVHSMTEKGE